MVLSRVLPTDAFDVSSGVAWLSTVTASARLPTSRAKSSVTNCWVPIRTALVSMVLKPCLLTFTV